MSEEDAFLDGIAADRADRTRLLVFADWLAEQNDPREEFVRVHTKLLDMDGTEPEFDELEARWLWWTGGTNDKRSYPLSLGVVPPRVSERWLDSLCRVFTTADTVYRSGASTDRPLDVDRYDFGSQDHCYPPLENYLSLYRGQPERFGAPFDFVVGTILHHLRLGHDPFRAPEPDQKYPGSRYLMPVTRGSFWRCWRRCCRELRHPPALPIIAPSNYFLGAQYLEGNWNGWAFVAVHRDDYFALHWSTTA